MPSKQIEDASLGTQYSNRLNNLDTLAHHKSKKKERKDYHNQTIIYQDKAFVSPPIVNWDTNREVCDFAELLRVLCQLTFCCHCKERDQTLVSIRRCKKWSIIFFLFGAHGNQFFAKTRVIVYNLNIEKTDFVQLSYHRIIE